MILQNFLTTKSTIHCLIYKSIEDLCTKIERFIDNDKKIEDISKNGLELSKRHTYDQRVKNIMELM